jgi:hypothetical protein
VKPSKKSRLETSSPSVDWITPQNPPFTILFRRSPKTGPLMGSRTTFEDTREKIYAAMH